MSIAPTPEDLSTADERSATLRNFPSSYFFFVSLAFKTLSSVTSPEAAGFSRLKTKREQNHHHLRENIRLLDSKQGYETYKL
jgi:hypothetical protein